MLEMLKGTRWIVVAFFLLTAVIIGCGGGSGSGGSTLPTATKVAVRAAALASDQSARAGVSYGMKALILAAPSGSGLKSLSPKFIKQGRRFATQLEYIAGLQLYDKTITTASGFSVQFFTDAAGTLKAGTIEVALATGTLGNAPSTSNVTINITAGLLPSTGSFVLDYSDKA